MGKEYKDWDELKQTGDIFLHSSKLEVNAMFLTWLL